MATTDPATLPALTTWYLFTNVPHPDSQRAETCPIPPADLAEVVRLYGLRHWVEQGYKQLKQELGWADFQVRSDRAIRRHWALVCCAFSFCWRAWFADSPETGPASPGSSESPTPEAGKKSRPTGDLACHPSARPRLAVRLVVPPALLASLVSGPTPTRAPDPPRRRRHRAPPQPLPPRITNYR